jgi:anti-sigma factor RsiW
MNCRDAVLRLLRLHDGTLPEPLLGETRRHVEACPACGALSRTYADTVATLHGLGRAFDPKDATLWLSSTFEEGALGRIGETRP